LFRQISQNRIFHSKCRPSLVRSRAKSAANGRGRTDSLTLRRPRAPPRMNPPRPSKHLPQYGTSRFDHLRKIPAPYFKPDSSSLFAISSNEISLRVFGIV
jgi:hypothetical protein